MMKIIASACFAGLFLVAGCKDDKAAGASCDTYKKSADCAPVKGCYWDGNDPNTGTCKTATDCGNYTASTVVASTTDPVNGPKICNDNTISGGAKCTYTGTAASCATTATVVPANAVCTLNSKATPANTACCGTATGVAVANDCTTSAAGCTFTAAEQGVCKAK